MKWTILILIILLTSLVSAYAPTAKPVDDYGLTGPNTGLRATYTYDESNGNYSHYYGTTTGVNLSNALITNSSGGQASARFHTSGAYGINEANFTYPVGTGVVDAGIGIVSIDSPGSTGIAQTAYGSPNGMISYIKTTNEILDTGLTFCADGADVDFYTCAVISTGIDPDGDFIYADTGNATCVHHGAPTYCSGTYGGFGVNEAGCVADPDCFYAYGCYNKITVCSDPITNLTGLDNAMLVDLKTTGTSWTNASWVTGRFENGAEFDGVADYLSYSTDEYFIAYDTVVLDFWLNNSQDWDQLSSDQTVMGDWDTNGGWYLEIDSGTDKLTFSFDDTGGTLRTTTCNKTSWDSSVWYHFYVEYDYADSGDVHILVDGVECSEGDLNFEMDNTNGANFVIGASSAAGEFYNGTIDDLGIYNTSLLNGSGEMSCSSTAYLGSGTTGWCYGDTATPVYTVTQDTPSNNSVVGWEDNLLFYWNTTGDWVEATNGTCNISINSIVNTTETITNWSLTHNSTLTGFTNPTNYNWTVFCNQSGNEGTSGIFNFTVYNYTIQLINPENNATGLTENVTFNWNLTDDWLTNNHSLACDLYIDGGLNTTHIIDGHIGDFCNRNHSARYCAAFEDTWYYEGNVFGQGNDDPFRLEKWLGDNSSCLSVVNFSGDSKLQISNCSVWDWDFPSCSTGPCAGTFVNGTYRFDFNTSGFAPTTSERILEFNAGDFAKPCARIVCDSNGDLKVSNGSSYVVLETDGCNSTTEVPIEIRFSNVTGDIFFNYSYNDVEVLTNLSKFNSSCTRSPYLMYFANDTLGPFNFTIDNICWVESNILDCSFNSTWLNPQEVNITGFPNATYEWNVTCNQSNNTGQSEMWNFTVGAAPVGNNSCTPPGSGLWDLVCSDNCNFSSLLSIPGNINITGVGLINISSGGWNMTAPDWWIRIYDSVCRVLLYDGANIFG